MTVGHFSKRSKRPSAEEIRLALGSVYPLWERLTRFVETRYENRGPVEHLGTRELWLGSSLSKQGQGPGSPVSAERVDHRSDCAGPSAGRTGTESDAGGDSKQDTERGTAVARWAMALDTCSGWCGC